MIIMKALLFFFRIKNVSSFGALLSRVDLTPSGNHKVNGHCIKIENRGHCKRFNTTIAAIGDDGADDDILESYLNVDR